MRLTDAIEERARRKSLSVSLPRLRYTVDHWISDAHGRQSVLDVGCGHGHLLVLLCKEYGFECGVGVDPYAGGEGNDETDLARLRRLIADEELDNRVAVRRETIQQYLSRCEPQRFSLILLADVLHHVFATPRPLVRERAAFEDCAALLRELRARLEDEGLLVIDEVERRGLRQVFGALTGRSAVEWATKQPHEQWRHAALEAGFAGVRRVVYVPFALRSVRPLLANALSAALLCPRYFLLYRP